MARRAIVVYGNVRGLLHKPESGEIAAGKGSNMCRYARSHLRLGSGTLIPIALLAVGIFASIVSAGFAAVTRPSVGTSIGPEGTSGSAFVDIQAVSVDPASGDVYVYDIISRGAAQGLLYKFSPSGEPLDFSATATNSIAIPAGALETEPGTEQVAVAPPGAAGGTEGDIYVATNAAVKVFSAGGLPIGELTGPEPCGVATDSSGHVFVGNYSGEQSFVREYLPAANPPADTVAAESAAPTPGTCNLAVAANGDIYSTQYGDQVAYVREGISDSTPKSIPLRPSGSGNRPGEAGLAIDPASGELNVSVGRSPGASTPEVRIYAEEAGSPFVVRGRFGDPSLNEIRGVALGAESAYVGDGATQKVDLYGELVSLPEVKNGEATEIKASSAVLHAEVTAAGGPSTSCKFEYAEMAKSFAEGSTVPCSPTGPFTGTGFIAVTAKVEGLTSGTEYKFRAFAENTLAAIAGEPLGKFTTIGVPSVTEASVQAASETSATIAAAINPDGLPTTFQVQYVTLAQFDASGFAGATVAPIPARELGHGRTAVAVSQEITGLAPGTAYRFRILASNELGAAEPPVSQIEGAFATFAMTSPGLPDGRAYELVSPPQKGSAELIPPEAPGSIDQSLGGSCFHEFSLVCTPGGQKVVGPMQSDPAGNAVAYFGQPFSPGLASGGNSYIGSRSVSGWSTTALTDSAFGSAGEGGGFRAFSADLSRGVVYKVRPPLSAEVPGKAGGHFAELYLAEGGTFRPLITAQPPNREATPAKGGVKGEFEISFVGASSGTEASGALSHVLFTANDALTGAEPNAPNAPPVAANERNLYEWENGQIELINVLSKTKAAAGAHFVAGDRRISSDGSHVFWEAGGKTYVRVDGVETLQIKDSGGGSFVTASADGATVLMSDGCLYDISAQKCGKGNLTAGKGGFQGILGTSQDLSRIYFIDTAELAGENNEHKSPVEGADNLYSWSPSGTNFIATLLPRDDENNVFKESGDWKPNAASRTAQITPDGSFLAFMSSAELTGYDNELTSCLHGLDSRCYEVFEYDAATATLSCPSCNPTGARPLGGANLTLSKGGYERGQNNLSPSGAGRLFFESRDALTPADRNGAVQDLYEWEPDGVGNCAKIAGCLSLISSGEEGVEEEPYFVDSSATGNDVFFITRARLVSADKDESLDLYDARVDGGFAEPPEVICDETSTTPCKGPTAAPPSQSSPGSNAPAVGNPTSKKCAKGFVKKHGKCVKKPAHHKKKSRFKKHKKKSKAGKKQQRGAKGKKRSGKGNKGGSK